MVYYSTQAYRDLDDVRNGLLLWEKIDLTVEFVFKYMEEIKYQCESIQEKAIHSKTVYQDHKKYGKMVHKYRRNPNTLWYVIYDIDLSGNIFINKIISNHTTKV